MTENIGRNINTQLHQFPSGTIEVMKPLTDSIANGEVSRLEAGRVNLVVLARETGPCGGVEMAEFVMDQLIRQRDGILEHRQEELGIYANHPPSKSADRAAMYEQAGVKFGKPLEEIPEGSIYVFSAHGADPAEVEKATQKGLRVVDTTCPLVGHIYRQINRASQNAAEEGIKPDDVGVVYMTSELYDPRHPEVIGTRGVARKAGIRFIPVTSQQEAEQLAQGESAGPEQVSLEGLKKVFVTGLTTNNSDTVRRAADAFAKQLDENGVPGDFLEPYDERSVCGTVKHRQNAIRAMVGQGMVSTIIVVGAIGSNNTNELVLAALDEASNLSGQNQLTLRRIIFANSHHDIPTDIRDSVGIVSGASTQQKNIDQIIEKLNISKDKIVTIGGMDKGSMFRPLGGPEALARRVLKDDFSWL